VTRHIAIKRRERKALGTDRFGQLRKQYEQSEAKIRTQIEHLFHVIKNLFRDRKGRYPGAGEKNTPQLCVLFGLANFFMARRRLVEKVGAA